MEHPSFNGAPPQTPRRSAAPGRSRLAVTPLTGKYCKQWLQTEYNTAVIRAHRAADWKHFESEKDVYPNLRWMPTTSAEPDPVHASFWSQKLTLPVNDPFWGHHHPGERWGCKCTCEQTDEPVNDLGMNGNYPDTASKGLHGNPAETGHLFSEDHPYYPKNCGSCPFSSGVRNMAGQIFNAKKDCSNCQAMTKNLKSSLPAVENNALPPKVESYIVDTRCKQVFRSPLHGANEVDENLRIGRFVSEKLKQDVYLLPRIDSNTTEQNALRKALLPKGVMDKKNPDYLIGGQLYDAKSMLEITSSGSKQIKRRIQKHIGEATDQAENVVIEIPGRIERSDIHNAINGYLSSAQGHHTVIVKWRDKCLIYSSTPKKIKSR